MTLLLMMRHAPTAWNAARRLQGRNDQPLSEEGREMAARWRLPARYGSFAWVTSPLRRCRETARLIVGGKAASDTRLIEMSWGDWEGRALEDLRRELGPAMSENEARGLDFQPPGGESPRMVQSRLLPLLTEMSEASQPRIAVTHRGVLRATFALATGWDMTTDAPARMEPYAGHLFRLDRAGLPVVERLNIPLGPPGGKGLA